MEQPPALAKAQRYHLTETPERVAVVQFILGQTGRRCVPFLINRDNAI
jgi:hypothetical protein